MTEIRIVEKANAWNHPAGMWWDSHIGEVFRVTSVREGIPRQYEVDVAHLDILGGIARAFIPTTYAEPSDVAPAPHHNED